MKSLMQPAVSTVKMELGMLLWATKVTLMAQTDVVKIVILGANLQRNKRKIQSLLLSHRVSYCHDDSLILLKFREKVWEGREGMRKAGPKSFNHSSKNRRFCCADVMDECFVSEENREC